MLAFRALPLILVVSALSALLFYWRALLRISQACAWMLRKTLRTGIDRVLVRYRINEAYS